MHIERFSQLKANDSFYFDAKDQLQVKGISHKVSSALNFRLPCISTNEKGRPSTQEVCKYLLEKIKPDVVTFADRTPLIALRRHFVAKKSHDEDVQNLVIRIETVLRKSSSLFALPSEIIGYIAGSELKLFCKMRTLSKAFHTALPLSQLLFSKMMQDSVNGHFRSIASLGTLIYDLLIRGDKETSKKLLEHFLQKATAEAQKEFIRQTLIHLRTEKLLQIMPLDIITSLKINYSYRNIEPLFDFIRQFRHDLTHLEFASLTIPSNASEVLHPIVNCKNLVSLDLSRVQSLDYSVLAAIVHLPKLQVLRVGLTFFRNITHAEQLAPSEQILVTNFRDFLREMTADQSRLLDLETLELRGTGDIIGAEDVSWGKFRRLRHVSLSQCTVSQAALMRLKALNLYSLDLENLASGVGTNKVFELGTLRELTLYSTDRSITELTPQLSTLPYLEKLSLDSKESFQVVPNLTRALLEVLTHCPHLKEITLKPYMRFAQEDSGLLLDLFQRNTSIESLAISGTLNVALTKAILTLPKLRSLSLSSAEITTLREALSDVAPQSHIQKLTISSFYGYSKKDDAGFIQALSRLYSLRHLEVGAWNLDDRDAATLSQLPRLETLVIRIKALQKRLTNKGLKQLSAIDTLKRLVIAGSTEIKLPVALNVLRTQTRITQFACSQGLRHDLTRVPRSLLQKAIPALLYPDQASDPSEIDLLRNVGG